MYTNNLKIKSISNPTFVDKKCVDFSFAFRYIYKTGDQIGQPEYQQQIKEKFNLNEIEYRSLISQVKQFNQGNKTQNTKKEKRIKTIGERLEEINSQNVITKREKREIYYLKRKRRFLLDSISNKSVFGGKKNLQTITFLNNLKNNQNIILDTKQIDRLTKAKQKYQDNRKRMIYLLGEANQKGNRFFEFDLPNNKIIYKPKAGIKIEILIENYKNKKEEFERIQNFIDNKLIAVTVSFDNDTISFTIDELTLNGYLPDTEGRLKEVNVIKKKKLTKEEEKIEINKIYVKYHRLLDEKKMIGKVNNRYIGIDLNPEYISYTVMDKLSENSHKIITKGCFDFTYFSIKLGKKSSHEDTLYQNNKRKHELLQALTTLFCIAKHYKCSYFVCEELEFDDSKVDTKVNSKEGNRKTKNLWNRELTVNFIKKNINCMGLILREINPCYTSFIGNICYGFFDPISSSIEITRRGIFGFEGGFYPNVDERNLHTVATLMGTDVEAIKNGHCGNTTWVGLYNFSNGFRWRRRLEDDKSLLIVSHSTTKSKVKHLLY